MPYLEKEKNLSESLLWNLQSDTYLKLGPDAWATSGVPFYLTSNPLIAKQFCHAILAFLRDLQHQKKLLLTEPFYLFDLGAGSGRLGYLILKQLVPMVHELISEELHLRYVMTDIVEANLIKCQNHPFLQDEIQTGRLDFALYHHAQTTPLHLLVSKQTLKPEKVKNPIALVCTYYFDTIPQDFFRVKDGKLEEGRISLFVPENCDSELDKINKLQAFYSYLPVDHPENYYEKQPGFNRLLKNYIQTFQEATFLYPIGGLSSLQFFSELSNRRFLLLAADQGVATKAQVEAWGEPKICKHATFSMPVSYHLMAEYFQDQGGVGLHTHFPNPQYVVMAGAVHEEEFRFANLKNAFEQIIDAFEPVDYFRLSDLSAIFMENCSLEQLLLYVKLGNWDPVNFNHYFSAILKKLPSSTPSEKERLYDTITRVFERFYPVSSEEKHFIINLGVLCFQMNRYQKALFFFEKALELFGPDDHLLTNISHCRRFL